MELKEYQSSALDAFSRWLDALAVERAEPEHDLISYPEAAWRRLREEGGVADSAGQYVSRTDGAGRPIPHVCFKVPTGGGKTLLAAAALERLNRQTGLTLWIVPTNAIYQQTKDALCNRDHPYRQMLERASGGRVKMLEKDDLFTRHDIEHYLCVMLVMLPAANRNRNKDFLRMFRDSGRYPDLYPDDDDRQGEAKLLERYPDLECHEPQLKLYGPRSIVKRSLFNVFKMVRPVVVLDEAHKAYGKQKKTKQEFVRAVNRLDPSLVIELSATPHPGISNLLVDIDGLALKDEEMIKLPINVTSMPTDDWRQTLQHAHADLERLQEEATSLQQNENRYIRPIAVVRVERTGANQRNGHFIHSEDVREYLINKLGVHADAVKVQSSELKELESVDLLSELTPVRWIITKDALKEGWDCSFAYMLVLLDNMQAPTGITQLVGRIMRQPHASRVDRGRKQDPLNECYVICQNIDVGKAVEQVRKGLENDGLTGLSPDVHCVSERAATVTVERRQRFVKENIFLPRVMHRDQYHADGWSELDFQRHILPAVNWDAIHVTDLQPGYDQRGSLQRVTVDLGGTPPVFHEDQAVAIDKSIKIGWYARRLGDIVPNPWQAARIAQEAIDAYLATGRDEDNLYEDRSIIADHLRHRAAAQVDTQSQQIFSDKLSDGDIRFDLDTDIPSHQLSTEPFQVVTTQRDTSFERKPGDPLQLSLFTPIMRSQFDSDLERNFAKYLDERKAIRWWHRVAARQRGEYYLRGWRRHRVWPDFIALEVEPGSAADDQQRLLVFETKGEHIADNDDTQYKRTLLTKLEDAFNAGQMRVREGPAQGIFRIVFSDQNFAAAFADQSPD